MNVLHIHSCICSFGAIKNLYAPMKCNRNRTSFEKLFLYYEKLRKIRFAAFYSSTPYLGKI